MGGVDGQRLAAELIRVVRAVFATLLVPLLVNVFSNARVEPIIMFGKHPLRWTAAILVLAYVGDRFLTSYVARRRRRADTPGDARPEVVRARFVEYVRGRYREAVEQRPELLSPIRLRWNSTGRGGTRQGTVSAAKPGASWARSSTDGDRGTLAATWLDLPKGYQQMVILGAAGAGKSASVIVLARELTDRLAENPALADPVPVLVQAAGWDPRTQDVREFVAGRVPEPYRRLIGSGAVLPILDGLDELAAELHAPALDRLKRHDGQVVVTCRRAEYDRVVRTTGSFLPRATVVEIQSVAIVDARAYLTDHNAAPDRWRPVFDGLDKPPLAGVFTSPLTVTLAATAYTPPDRDPAELLGLAGPAEVQARLLDGFVSAAYEGDDPVRKQRWLATLAHQLDVAATRTLRWGQLDPDLDGDTSTLRFGLIAAAVMVAFCVPLFNILLVSIGFVPERSLDVTVTVGVGAGGILCALMLPRRWHTTVRGATVFDRPNDIALWIGYGVCFGWFAGGVTGKQGLGMLTGLAVGALLAVLPWRSPRPAPASDRYALLAARTTPLRMRRPAFAAALHAAMAFVIFTTAARPGETLSGALRFGLACAVTFGVGAGLATGWLRWLGFRLTHLRLVLAGRLPLRLRTFLDGACRRGVLRHIGDGWQFRHAILFEHFARVARDVATTDHGSGWQVAELLIDAGNIDALRALAVTNDAAAYRLADWLCARARTTEAVAVLRRHALVDIDHPRVADLVPPLVVRRLAELLLAQGSRAEAEPLLRRLADRGDWAASWRLAQLSATGGDLTAVRKQAETGSRAAGWYLLRALAETGDLDEVVRLTAAWAGEDNWFGAWFGLTMLVRHGRLDAAESMLTRFRKRADYLDWKAESDDFSRGLYTRIPTPSRYWGPASKAEYVVRWSADRIAEALLADGRIEDLRRRPASAEDGFAAIRCLAQAVESDEAIALLRQRGAKSLLQGLLAERLAARGRFDEALRALDSDFEPTPLDGIDRAEILAAAGRSKELIAMAVREDDIHAAALQVALLTRLGRVAEAVEFLDRWRASGGSPVFGDWACTDHARIEQLRVRADLGGVTDARRLAELLDRRERTDEEIRTEEEPCRRALLLALRGRLGEAVRVLRTEPGPDDPVAGPLLANLIGELTSLEDSLVPWIDGIYGLDSPYMRHGPYGPSAGVAGLLVAQDRRDEAIARLSMDAGNGSQLSAWQLTLLLGSLPS